MMNLQRQLKERYNVNIDERTCLAMITEGLLSRLDVKSIYNVLYNSKEYSKYKLRTHQNISNCVRNFIMYHGMHIKDIFCLSDTECVMYINGLDGNSQCILYNVLSNDKRQSDFLHGNYKLYNAVR